MRTKLTDFYLAVLLDAYDIIVLSETWLTDSISDNEFIDNRYTVFRKDRSEVTSDKLCGGGVLIAVKKNLQAYAMDMCTNNREEVWVAVHVNDKKVILCAVYFSPMSAYQKYLEHVALVEEIITKDEVSIFVVAGDYNLRNIQWEVEEGLDGLSATHLPGETDQLIYDMFSYCGLRQFNSVKNLNCVVLDLLFSNDCLQYFEPKSLLPCDVHHPAVSFKLNIVELHELQTEDVFYFDFNNASYNNIKDHLDCINWESLFLDTDLECCVNTFYDVLYSTLDVFVPKIKRMRSSFPKWFSPELINLIKQKKAAHKKYKQTNSELDYNNFSQLRNLCKNSISLAHQTYLRQTENAITYDIKCFWRYVQSKTKDIKTVPTRMYYNNNLASDGVAVANFFCEYFKSIYSKSNHVDVAFEYIVSQLHIPSLNVTCDEIGKCLNELSVKKGPGPDGLPPSLLRHCSDSLIKPLFLLFNMSLDSGVFPSIWKHTFIVPVFKSGNRNDVRNYRPISIQSAIPKVLDKLVSIAFQQLFKNIIVSQQHGFYSSRSTCTNLFPYVNFIYDSMEEGFVVDSVYTDFSKAFDRVNHKLLFAKLKAYGIDGTLLAWIISFVTNRYQQINVNNFKSSKFTVPSGVPQGSHLGPILFSIFINDIGLCLNSDFLLFADDLKLFRKIVSHADCVILQNDLENLVQWCTDNDMHLNIDKCKHIRFSKKRDNVVFNYYIENELLQSVSVIRDLGVLLDSSLSFVNHIDFIVSRAMRMSGFIKRITLNFTNVRCLVILYVSLVRSILDYNCIIWAPVYNVHIDRIERVQRKIVKALCYKANIRCDSLNYEQLLQYFGFHPMHIRRNYFELCFAFKILNGHISCSDILSTFNLRIPPFDARFHSLLLKDYRRTNYGCNSPLQRIVRIVNKLNNVDIIGISFASFIRNIKSWLDM